MNLSNHEPDLYENLMKKFPDNLLDEKVSIGKLTP